MERFINKKVETTIPDDKTIARAEFLYPGDKENIEKIELSCGCQSYSWKQRKIEDSDDVINILQIDVKLHKVYQMLAPIVYQKQEEPSYNKNVSATVHYKDSTQEKLEINLKVVEGDESKRSVVRTVQVAKRDSPIFR